MNTYTEVKKDKYRYIEDYMVISGYYKVMEDIHYNSSTPFDDTFRTECVRMKEWMIPLINEVFGTTYDSHSNIVMYENEQMMLASVDTDDLKQRGIPKKITDSVVRIDDQVYHLECQTGEDGTILIRVITYDFQVAIQTTVYDYNLNTLTIQIPQSAVIYLRRDKKMSPMTVIYQCGDQEMRVSIPTVSAQSYSLAEIFDKKLYFLIPYYFMRYENEFERGIGMENEQIRTDIEQLNQRLFELREEDAITGVQLTDLVQLIHTVVKQITRKLEDEKRERIVKSMGGKVLEMESDRILNEGRMDEKQTIAIRLYQKGTKAEDIADIVDAKVNIVRKWIETL